VGGGNHIYFEVGYIYIYVFVVYFLDIDGYSLNARNVGSLQIYVVNRISWEYVFTQKMRVKRQKGIMTATLDREAV
jgi:uncharacterized membrane protein